MAEVATIQNPKSSSPPNPGSGRGNNFGADKLKAMNVFKENADALSKYAPIAQKATQLGAEVARFAGQNKLGSRLDSASAFVTPKSPAKPAEQTEQSSLTEERAAKPQPQTLTGKIEDIKFVEKYKDTEKILKMAEELARMSGFEEAADMAEIIRDGLHDGTLNAQDLENGDAGAVREKLSNSAGKLGGALARSGALEAGASEGLASGLEKAGGGAIAAAMQGEGAVGIGQNALSWYVVDFALGSLLTPWSPVALIYLDFHYLAAKFGSKWFRMPTLWQRLTIWAANLIYIIGILIFILLFMVEVCNDPSYSRVLGGATNQGAIGKAKGIIFGAADICSSFSLSNYVLGTATGSPSTSTPPTLP